MSENAVVRVQELSMGFGDFVLQRDLSFDVRTGDIFIIMGGSGCGKSTLLRHMLGLQEPLTGSIWYGSTDFTAADDDTRETIIRGTGVLYQSGALWSSMTLAENVALPLEEFTDLGTEDIAGLVALKLALVGLAGFEDYYPAQLSGGMLKRAGLARALALDPDVLFFDEPSAGLDPISARRMDDLILELRDGLGSTIIVVTHELPSIFAIGSNGILLDADSRTMIAQGRPRDLLRDSTDPRVRAFLTRGEER